VGTRLAVRRGVAALCSLALVLVVLAVPVGTASAAATVPFTPKFSANANGAMVTVGNNLLTCPAGGTSNGVSCAAARAGGVADDNGYVMTNLDADADPTTFNSSSSTLTLPAGATVLWAGLYWGARLTAGSGGQSAGVSAANQIAFRAPGDGSYRTLAASTATRDQFGPNASSYNAYQRFADVTSIVQGAGNGAYWGANVAAATGADRYAGWAMTVVYTAPGLPLRNLTVFDGFDVVQQGNPQNVTVSGFQAPLSGTVDAQLTMVAYEGDLSQTGDYTRLDNTQLASAVSPGSNFFDSVDELNGASVTTRTPADRNMLGFDIKNLGASGAIGNGDTSAQFTFSSNGDVYYPGVVGLAINLYAPDFTASAKTVVDVNGNSPARPGDTLQYTLSYANTGQDPAVGVASSDPLPDGTTYVPGSLALVNPLTGATTPLTDGAGDDVGTYDAGSRTVTVRLGSGASATAGGRMACSGSGCTDNGTSRQVYTFRVTLDDAAGGTTVTNLASLAYRTGTTNIAATYTTNPASVDVVRQADVAITKVLSPSPAAVGSTVTATVTVTNRGPNVATDVTVTDPISAGWTDVTLASPVGGCAVGGGALRCALGDLPPGRTVTATLTGQTSSSSTATSLTNVARATTTAYDPDPTNNVATDTIALTRQADLAVTKTAEPESAPAGSAVTWTVRVTNRGASDAQDVRVADALDDAAVAGGGTCTDPTGRGLSCALPALAAGDSAVLTVRGRLGTDLAAGTAVGNTASVSSSTPDPEPGNDTATATVTTTAPVSDVRVTKDGPTSVVAGETVTWTVTATDFGPSDAAGVVVTDAVPADVTDVRATSSRGTCSVTGRDVSCAVGALPSAGDGVAGASATITVTGTVAPGTTGTLRNTASATADTADPAPGNDSATATTDVVARYDLAVSKTANRTALPGQDPPETRPVDYVVTVTNNGPSTATGVTVSDLVPTALRLDSATPTAGGSCTAPVATDDAAHDLLTCTLTTPLAPGDSQTIAVDMTATTNLAAIGDPVSETATVHAAGDTNGDNDSATWTLAGEPFTDLALQKTADPTVTAGATATYTFQVTNTNDPTDVAENLSALRPITRDTLPDGVTYVPGSATVTSGAGQTVACTATGQALACQLGQDVDAGDSVTFQVTVRVASTIDAGTSLVNTASVSSANPASNPDNNPANDTSTATSTVQALADVAVTALTADPVNPAWTGAGTQRHVHLELTNEGPSTARDVEFRIERTVDAFVVDTGTLPVSCTSTARELVCTIAGADLAPGQTVDVDYVIEVAPYAQPGTYPETVRASTTTPESTLENNSRGASIVVGPPVTDLVVAKTAVGTVPNPDEATSPHDAFVAGGPFAYQITVRVPSAPDDVPGAGYADAGGATLRDLLPVGFTAATVSTTGGGLCTLDPVLDPGVGVRTQLSCDLGTVPGWNGTQTPPTVVVTVHGTLDPDANNLNGGDTFAEQVPNTAVVTTTTPLPDGQTEKRGTVAVDVAEQADLRLVKTPDTPTVNAGGTLGYTLTVINTGPSGVEHAVVTDSLPVGFALDGAQSGCTPPEVGGGVDETQVEPQVSDGPGTEVACRVGVVAAGQSVSIHVVARTDAALAEGTAVNTATVGAFAHDPDEADNTAAAPVAVARLTDLAISANPSTTTPAAGQDVTFTGYATNNGPSTAVDTTGRTVFPPGFVPVSADVPFNTCTWDPAPPADPESAAWEDVAYTLTCVPQTPGQAWEAGGATTNVVVMHVPGDTPAGAYSGSSTIRSDTPETDLDNNTVRETLTVQHVSDTRLTKTLVDPNPMLSGRPATWRLTVTNAGPSVADGVVVSDNVPAGMTYESARVEGGAACPSPERYSTALGDTETILRCPAGSVPAGGSTSVLVTFDVGTGQVGDVLCNAALVGSGSLDPDATDNEDQACGVAAAPPSADVAIALDPPSQGYDRGDRAVLGVTVRDDGPGDATHVVAVLDLPPGLTDCSGVAVSWPPGRPKPPDGVVGSLTFAVGDLAPGEDVVYRVVCTVTAPPGSVLRVDGSTTHDEPDPVVANDTDDALVRVAGASATATPTPSGTASPTATTSSSAAPSSTGTPPSAAAPPAGPPAEQPPGLAITGAGILGVLAAALVAVAAGVALVAVRRRSDGGP